MNARGRMLRYDIRKRLRTRMIRETEAYIERHLSWGELLLPPRRQLALKGWGRRKALV